MTFTGTSDGTQSEKITETEGMKLELRDIDGDVYVRGDKASYSIAFSGDDESVADVLADEWVVSSIIVSDDENIGEIYSSFLDDIETGQISDGQLQNVEIEETELNGEDVLKYTGTDSLGESSEFIFNEDHELVRTEIEDFDGPVTATFSDWNDAPEVKAPKDAIDLDDPESFEG